MNKKKLSILIFTSIFILTLTILSLFLLSKNSTDSDSSSSKKEKMSTSRIASDTEYKNNDVEDEYAKLLAKKEDVPPNAKGENDSTAEPPLKSSTPTTSEKKSEENKNLEESKSLIDSVGTYKIKKIDGIKFRIYSDGKRIPDANMTDTKSTTKPNEKLVKKNTPDIMDKENIPDYLLKNKDEKLPSNYHNANKYSKLLAKSLSSSDGEIRAENDGKAKFASLISDDGMTYLTIMDTGIKGEKGVDEFKRVIFEFEWYKKNPKKVKNILDALKIQKETSYLLNEAKKVLTSNYVSYSKEHKITYDSSGGVQFEFYD